MTTVDRPAVTRAFTSTLSSKRSAAGVLFTDSGGRLLLVEPTYKKYWDLPGGMVEHNESPSEAASREVNEELGLSGGVGRLLVVDYFPSQPQATEALMFVYDGGHLTTAVQARIQLQPDELRSWAWCTPDVAAARTEHAPLLRRRIAAAWRAWLNGDTYYLEAGMPVA